MKITTTFLLLISVFFFLFASRANSQYLIFDPNYYYENLLAKQNGVKEKKVYDTEYELYETDKFDIEGRLIEMYFRGSYSNFIYDNDGKLIKENQVWGDEKYEVIYYYNSDNKLIKCVGSEGSDVYIEITYDDNGYINMVAEGVYGYGESKHFYRNNKLIYEEWESDGNLKGIIEYYYDGDKLIQTIEKNNSINPEKEFTESGNIKYEYYENGLIKEINNFGPRSGDYIISRFEYTYY